MHVLALVFELAVVAVTLMSLLSNMRHPDRQASPEAIEEQREQVIATLVSLGTTLVTFVLTMVGAGDAVKGLRTIGTRISAVGQRISYIEEEVLEDKHGKAQQSLSVMNVAVYHVNK